MQKRIHLSLLGASRLDYQNVLMLLMQNLEIWGILELQQYFGASITTWHQPFSSLFWLSLSIFVVFVILLLPPFILSYSFLFLFLFCSTTSLRHAHTHTHTHSPTSNHQASRTPINTPTHPLTILFTRRQHQPYATLRSLVAGDLPREGGPCV